MKTPRIHITISTEDGEVIERTETALDVGDDLAGEASSLAASAQRIILARIRRGDYASPSA